MKPQLTTTTVEQVDHLATGQSCRLYRKQSRVPLTALADKLGLNKAQLSHMEAGRRKWDYAILERYILTCDELSAQMNPDINNQPENK